MGVRRRVCERVKVVGVDYMRWSDCVCAWSSHVNHDHQCCHSAFNPVPLHLLQLTPLSAVYLVSARWLVRRSALTQHGDGADRAAQSDPQDALATLQTLSSSCTQCEGPRLRLQQNKVGEGVIYVRTYGTTSLLWTIRIGSCAAAARTEADGCGVVDPPLFVTPLQFRYVLFSRSVSVSSLFSFRHSLQYRQASSSPAG